MTDPISSLSKWRRQHLESLIEALGDPPMSFPEKASLAIIAGQDDVTVHHLTEVIHRAMLAAKTRNETEDTE